MRADQSIQNHFSALLRTFDKISDFVFFMEVDGPSYRYVFVNEPGKRAIGWTDADIGKCVEDMVPTETGKLITRYYDEALRERKSIVYEDYQLDDSFHSEQYDYQSMIAMPIHYYESEVTPVFDETGECTHIISVVREVTERKRRELELSILRDQHESLRRYSPHGIFVLDNELKIKSINPAVAKITGYVEQDLVNHSFLGWIPSSERQTVHEGLRFALTGVPHKYSISAIKKSGESLDLAVLNIPIEISGNIAGLFAIIIDHTREKKAERATQESESRYRQLIETIPEGIIVHRNGTVLYANAVALNMVESKSVIGKSVFEFISPAQHARTLERLSALQVGHPVQNSELTLITAKRNLVSVDIGSLLINYEGAPAALTILQDVTEKREMEQALRQSEMKYRLITENMSDLVCIMEQDGRVRYASPSHLTVLGYPPEIYEGENTLNYIHPDDIEPTRAKLHTLNQNSETLTFEFRHLHLDGRWIWLEAKIQAIYDNTGKLLHYLTVTREIMKRKVLEKKLKHLAYHDPLTELPNRRYFLAYLEESIARMSSETDMLAILSLDIDYFKQINDTLGHDVGDELLRQFALRLKQVLRKQDIVARFGGDEFCILLRYTNRDGLEQVAEKLIKILQLPWQIEQQSFVTTSSIGVACYEPGMIAKSLLKQADLALYVSKSNGRNQFTIYGDR